MQKNNVISFEPKNRTRDGEQDAVAGADLSNIVINIIATIGAGLVGWLLWYLVMPS